MRPSERLLAVLRSAAAASAAALLAGCIVLPPEARNLVSDVNSIKNNLAQVGTALSDLRREASSGQTSLVESDASHFRRLHSDSTDILSRLDEIERRLLSLETSFDDYAHNAAGANRSEPLARPRSTTVTTGGVVLSGAELLSLASQSFDRVEYDKAADLYNDILSRFGGSELADDAQLGLGKCLQFTENYPEALTAYLTIPNSYPGSPLASEARFRAASCARNMGDKRRALALLDEIVLKDPSYADMAIVRRDIRELSVQP
jgi:TolA-binding protein